MSGRDSSNIFSVITTLLLLIFPILFISTAHLLKYLFVANQRGDSIMYLGYNANNPIGNVVAIKNQVQSRNTQNTIGIMEIPIVQPMHCIIAMWARSSSFEVSIAIINGLKKIDIDVIIDKTDAIAKRR